MAHENELLNLKNGDPIIINAPNGFEYAIKQKVVKFNSVTPYEVWYYENGDLWSCQHYQVKIPND